AEDGIRDFHVTGVQTCALPICQFRITIGSTNLRQSPSVQAASMGYALADQTYTVIATTLTGDWVQVRGETQPVWIGSQYGTFEGNCIAPPARLLAGGERAVLNNRLLEFSPDSQLDRKSVV